MSLEHFASDIGSHVEHKSGGSWPQLSVVMVTAIAVSHFSHRSHTTYWHPDSGLGPDHDVGSCLFALICSYSL